MALRRMVSSGTILTEEDSARKAGDWCGEVAPNFWELREGREEITKCEDSSRGLKIPHGTRNTHICRPNGADGLEATG